MDERMLRKRLRREFHFAGWSLVAYYFLMNALVAAVASVDTVIKMAQAGSAADEELITQQVMQNAWGYLLCSVITVVAILLWKGKGFFVHQIGRTGKPMTVGRFFAILCVFLSGQLVFQLAITFMEMLLRPMGISLTESIESASMGAESLSMFLYMGVAAPIVEEIVFRGLILRMMVPYGKKFAIVMSAFLFGIFHGNVVQSPFAFVIGLVLGYTALEHNITWAMLLHMVNNLVLADMLGRITAPLGEMASNAVMGLMIWAFGIAGAVVLLVKRREIGAWLRQERMNPAFVRAFFTNPGVIVLMILMLINMALFFLM